MKTGIPTKPLPTPTDKRIALLEAMTKELAQANKAQDGTLRTQAQQLASLKKTVEALAPDSGTKPKNWQAMLVNKSLGISPVYKNGDSNNDGFTSIDEAVKAAEKFILDNNLGTSYVPSAMATY